MRYNRCRAGLSQAELANAIGMHQSAVSREESERDDPTIIRMAEICLALRVDMPRMRSKRVSSKLLIEYWVPGSMA
jgi:transcriptional regulator with XRE-family HTH domain